MIQCQSCDAFSIFCYLVVCLLLHGTWDVIRWSRAWIRDVRSRLTTGWVLSLFVTEKGRFFTQSQVLCTQAVPCGRAVFCVYFFRNIKQSNFASIWSDLFKKKQFTFFFRELFLKNSSLWKFGNCFIFPSYRHDYRVFTYWYLSNLRVTKPSTWIRGHGTHDKHKHYNVGLLLQQH